MEDTVARIPYPDKKSLPQDVQKLLDEASQAGTGHIFWMWSYSVNTVRLIAHEGLRMAGQKSGQAH
jgi:hypothetical protein